MLKLDSVALVSSSDTGQTACFVGLVPIARPHSHRSQRPPVSSVVCLATSSEGGPRRLSQAAREYADG